MINMKDLTSSKRLAIFIVCSTVVLTFYCITKGLEGLGAAVWTSGIVAGPALYANKQYQERKKLQSLNNNTANETEGNI